MIKEKVDDNEFRSASCFDDAERIKIPISRAAGIDNCRDKFEIGRGKIKKRFYVGEGDVERLNDYGWFRKCLECNADDNTERSSSTATEGPEEIGILIRIGRDKVTLR